MLNYRTHNLWRAFQCWLMRKWLLKNRPITRVECKKHTLFMTKMAKISSNWYPIYDQNSWKTIPFGVADTYIAHIMEYFPSPQGGRGTLYVLIYQTWRATQTCKLRFVGGFVLFLGIFWEIYTLQLFKVDVYSFCLLMKLECTRK